VMSTQPSGTTADKLPASGRNVLDQTHRKCLSSAAGGSNSRYSPIAPERTGVLSSHVTSLSCEEHFLRHRTLRSPKSIAVAACFNPCCRSRSSPASHGCDARRNWAAELGNCRGFHQSWSGRERSGDLGACAARAIRPTISHRLPHDIILLSRCLQRTAWHEQFRQIFLAGAPFAFWFRGHLDHGRSGGLPALFSSHLLTRGNHTR
jgi:hypothetical protein